MARSDFLDILREIRGSAVPGQPITDGIWYELTAADKNGNPGIYGDILAKYGVVTESAGTFDQAVAILENLNVEVTTLPAGSNATSALVNGVWQIGLPRGTNGIDGIDGNTPELTMMYDAGNIKYTVVVDGVVVTNTNLIDLDTLVDSKVSTNVGVQETLEAKQDVLDAVATAQGISDSLDANVVAKKQEIATYTNAKINEIGTQVELEKIELGTHIITKVNEYNTNALNKLNQYNDNHTNRLSVYNANDAVKLQQYNENHIERLENINYAYADRIVDLLNTKKTLGVVDEYTAKEPTKYAKFLDTTGPDYLYYLNGIRIIEGTDFIVKDNKTIELVQPIVAYDVIFQIDLTLLEELLINNHVLIEPMKGIPNGVASLDENALVPASQLPSYVDDVIEVATYADLPTVGESGKIYVVVADETSMGDTSSYRWTGTTYAMVSNTLNAADVKALYEANPDTNAYTDAEKFKLTSVEYGATADQTASEIETLYESNVNTNKYTDAEKSRIDINTNLTTTAQTLPTAVNEIDNRVANIEDNTTLAEYGIVDAYTKTEVDSKIGVSIQGYNANTVIDAKYVHTDNNFTTLEKTKLSGIESGAQVNTVTSVVGKTGAVTLAKGDVGLSNVDNTSDINKPISTATQTALNSKVDKVSGKGLSTEDYTTAEKTKLSGIAAGAQVNVPTDLSLGTATGTTLPLNSSTGTDVVLPAVTTTTAGLMSSTDKTKLDGIATGANNYVLPIANPVGIGGIKVSATAQTVAANAVTATASRTYAVQLDASGNALVNVPWVDTNTVYTHPNSGVTAGTYKSVTVNADGHITAGTNPTTLVGYGITDAATSGHSHTDASTTVSGFMSASDKVKLNSLSNYNKPASEPISYITGLQTELDSKTTMTDVNIAINNIVGAAPEALNTLAEIANQLANDESVVSSLTTAVSNKVDKVAGKQLSTEDYTSLEKTKLNNIENNANNYTLPVATANGLGGVKIGAGLTISNGVVSVSSGGVADSVQWSGVESTPTTLAGYGITDAAALTHTHSIASTYSNGLMSTADKTKLDGIEVGATGDQTASEILTLLKTVDGSGSGVDADLLDGQEGAYYLNASNINTGIINDLYLPDTITSNITGNAATATKLATAKTISLTGDVTGDVSFDGNTNVSITTTVADDSHNHVISNVDGLQVALDSKVDKVSKHSLDSNSALRVNGTTVSLYKGDGTFDSITTQDTVYTLPTATSTVKGGIEIFSDTVQTVASNTVSTTADRTYGIQLNSAGQAVVNVPWSDTNTVYTHPNSGATAGTYSKVTVNTQGHITAGASLSASDIPNLDASKITTGTIDAARLPSFVDDILEFVNLAGFPATGEAGKIYIALDTNKTYRWSGSTYVYITSGAVDSVAGKTGIVTLVKADVGLGNVDNTSDLNKPISTATQTALNGKADKATTLSGYGITDAYTKTEVGTVLDFTTALG